MIAEPSPVPIENKRSIESWIQLPRRLLFLLMAYGVARLFLAVLPVALPESISSSQAAGEIVSRSLPATIQLLVAAFFVALLLAVLPFVIGMLADSLERSKGVPGSILKGLGRLAVFPLGSLPVIALGFLILALSLRMGIRLDSGSPVLAVFTLALYPAMILAQSTTRMLTLARPVSTGRRVGAAILLFLGNIFAQTAGLLSAGLMVEVIFNRPGLGRLFLLSILNRDYPVSIGVMAVFLFLVFSGRFLAELFQAGARLILADTPEFDPEPVAWRQKARIVWVVFALALLILPAGIAAVGLITPTEQTTSQELADRNAPPSAEHLFGTDELGRDVRARVFKGAGQLIIASGLTAFLGVIVAAPLGILTGFLHNRRTWQWESLSDLMLLPFDIGLMFPVISLLILVVAAFSIPGRSGIIALLLALIIIPRGIRAARTMWQSRAVLENRILNAGLVVAALFLGLLFSGFSMLLALDYLGLFIAPPSASLGTDIQNIIRFLALSPSRLVFPLLLILLISFPFYLAADALIGFFHTKEVMVRLNE